MPTRINNQWSIDRLEDKPLLVSLLNQILPSFDRENDLEIDL